MSELQAPGLAAVEAYGRADGVIQQIDRFQRDRQTSALLRIAPSPLNPANWGPALQDGYKLAAGLVGEVSARLANQGGWSGAREWLPKVAGVLLAALLLLTKGRRWIDSLPMRLSARVSDRTRATLVFAVSLGQIFVPLLGVVLLVIALLVTGLFGAWGRPLIMTLPAAGLAFFAGVWLSRRIFPRRKTIFRPACRYRTRRGCMAAATAWRFPRLWHCTRSSARPSCRCRAFSTNRGRRGGCRSRFPMLRPLSGTCLLFCSARFSCSG
ncbi:DUF3772 domain-containing protein [Paracoccus cavernae]|uniref:DUF3772 domain-containing protein n=1 Tax=Paracoccus cavernae TaxID=1571207 RepID=UPI00363A86DD